MRIVGGRLRGRPIVGPDSDAIRPTSDRLREAIFNMLAHAYGDPVSGARVLDLFAGTGAMAFEALSRGAECAHLVELSAGAGRIILRNAATLELAGSTRLMRRDATRLGSADGLGPFDLVFCDPPYGRDLARPALEATLAGSWLTPGALIVVEERAGCAPVLPAQFSILERRSWAGTEVAFARLEG